jgi:hypothetical protein
VRGVHQNPAWRVPQAPVARNDNDRTDEAGSYIRLVRGGPLKAGVQERRLEDGQDGGDEEREQAAGHEHEAGDGVGAAPAAQVA